MEKTIEIQKIKEVFQKNIAIILIIPLILMIISAIFSLFVLPEKYQATTQILINQKKDENPQYMAQEVQSNIQLVNTYSEIVKSPAMLDKVSKELDGKYSTNDLSKMLSVSNQKETQILNIEVVNTKPQDAEKIANAFAKVSSDEIPKIMNVDNVSVLSKADGTVNKVSPKTLLNIIGALFVGIILATLFIIFKEIFDKRIKDESDVERELDIPVIGSIQKFK
ncbi:Wzz/FepE/Etk N-terminal domain-containing protein [Staphylococcus warneri]|uniref:Wzz/FepE/Etk N-terminal domain-containing protein n=1 Tax=Staphylococcus warneri TaxID=1292 RepID=UPI00326071E8